MKRRRLYPGRLFDSDPEAMARGQRKIRARARHWRRLARLRRENRTLAERAPELNATMVERTGRTLDEARDLLVERVEQANAIRPSTWNRRRRRHGMRAR